MLFIQGAEKRACGGSVAKPGMELRPSKCQFYTVVTEEL